MGTRVSFRTARTNCAMGTGGRLDSLKLWMNRQRGSGNDVGMLRTRRATRVCQPNVSVTCVIDCSNQIR